MGLGDLDWYVIFDAFLLLLIGMGPKIALVPYIELTKDLEAETQRRVADRMVRTALVTALVLVVIGWLLMHLLHFTSGAANVAGGIVLLLLALRMLVSPGKTDHEEQAADRDPMQMAVYPLAVPLLLNPAGIAVLVIASADLDSLLSALLWIGLVLLVTVINFATFRNMDKLSKHLDPSRLMVTEAVFGVLLAALAVQLMFDGLAEMSVIAGIGH
jgi:multiple antibiotic resistance protein